MIASWRLTKLCDMANGNPYPPAREKEKYTTREKILVGIIGGFLTGILLMGVVQFSFFLNTTTNLLAAITTSLEGVFVPGNEDDMNGTATSTPWPPTGTSTPPIATSTPPSATTTPGIPTSGVYPLPGGNTSGPYYGLADLIPLVRAVGYIDPSTNTFVATTSVRAGQRAAIQFAVQNVGTNISGRWTFNAVLPTYAADVFYSQEQQELRPGDRIEYTLGFDSINPSGDGRFTININPTRTSPESNYDNDIIRTNFIVQTQ